MQKRGSYFLYFLFGAAFGLVVTCATRKSMADYIGHGLSNIFIYGGIGYSIFAIKSKDYKKLWFALLILSFACFAPMIVFGL